MCNPRKVFVCTNKINSMDQQQNQQQTDDLQKKAEQALTASFAMPPIRTMADDLLEASKGVNVPVVSATPVASSSVKQIAVQTPPVPPKPPFSRPGPFIVPNVSPKPVTGNKVALPAPSSSGDKRSFMASMFFGGATALIIAVVVFTVYVFWPKKTNTIADKIPSETIAFVSIKRGSGALEQAVLPKILASMNLEAGSLGSQWSDLVYGIIPGSTPSEPVSYLMTNDSASVNFTTNANLAFKKMANGNGIIVDAKETGRLDGLSGKNLGDLKQFRALISKLPASPEYLYFGAEGSSFLKSFSLLQINDAGSTLFAIAPSTQGGKALPLMVARSGDAQFAKSQLSWEMAVKAIPASVIAVAGHGNLVTDVEQWRLSQSGNAQLQDFLNTLTTQGSAIDALKANLTGEYLVGTVANDTPVPDGIAVIPIKDGTTALVQAQMNSLEQALKLLGPLIGGASYSDVVFADGNYKDVAIRFVNFGDSNHSFDYAIVDSLLLVATSKGSMQQMIDAYKGDAENFAAAFVAQSTGQVGWQYLRFDGKILDQQPMAWKKLFSGFVSTYFEPIKTGVYTGNIAY